MIFYGALLSSYASNPNLLLYAIASKLLKLQKKHNNFKNIHDLTHISRRTYKQLSAISSDYYDSLTKDLDSPSEIYILLHIAIVSRPAAALYCWLHTLPDYRISISSRSITECTKITSHNLYYAKRILKSLGVISIDRRKKAGFSRYNSDKIYLHADSILSDIITEFNHSKTFQNVDNKRISSIVKYLAHDAKKSDAFILENQLTIANQDSLAAEDHLLLEKYTTYHYKHRAVEFQTNREWTAFSRSWTQNKNYIPLPARLNTTLPIKTNHTKVRQKAPVALYTDVKEVSPIFPKTCRKNSEQSATGRASGPELPQKEPKQNMLNSLESIISKVKEEFDFSKTSDHNATLYILLLSNTLLLLTNLLSDQLSDPLAVISVLSEDLDKLSRKTSHNMQFEQTHQRIIETLVHSVQDKISAQKAENLSSAQENAFKSVLSRSEKQNEPTPPNTQQLLQENELGFSRYAFVPNARHTFTEMEKIIMDNKEKVLYIWTSWNDFCKKMRLNPTKIPKRYERDGISPNKNPLIDGISQFVFDNEDWKEQWDEALDIISKTDFLLGKNQFDFCVTLAWLFKNNENKGTGLTRVLNREYITANRQHRNIPAVVDSDGKLPVSKITIKNAKYYEELKKAKLETA